MIIVWTEIITEDICVTHVDDCHVVTPITNDVDAYKMRGVKEQLESRDAREHVREQMRETTEQIEQEQVFHEQLREITNQLKDEFDITSSKRVRETGRRLAHLPD